MSRVAVAAIVRYERAAKRNAEFRVEISDALCRCTVSKEMDAVMSAPPYRCDESKYMDGNHVRTHLHESFKETTDCDSEYFAERKLSPDEITDWLSDTECQGCIDAWDLIQERKEVRREFGIAKRAIRSIGRAELAKEGGK